MKKRQLFNKGFEDNTLSDKFKAKKGIVKMNVTQCGLNNQRVEYNPDLSNILDNLSFQELKFNDIISKVRNIP